MSDTPPPFASQSFSLPDADHTELLARALAPTVLRDASIHGARLYLRGELGAGKTCFARALLRACGVSGRIKSPSYALLESYNVSSLYLYHLDFYRFNQGEEWRDAGFEDILHARALVLVEWPEHAGGTLPTPDLEIQLDYAASGRHALLTAHSPQGNVWMQHLPPQTRLAV